jgi:DNA-binding NarL/FixJ family response regulator
MKQAADVLDITTRTVAFHKYRIMEDFGLKNNSDLVRLAISERLIPQALIHANGCDRLVEAKRTA